MGERCRFESCCESLVLMLKVHEFRKHRAIITHAKHHGIDNICLSVIPGAGESDLCAYG